jgi:anaerobic selenocysteine-containing dehydrogenase
LHACPLCEACCGLAVTIDAGVVTDIRGHARDVFSGGFVCPKGAALKELHEDPDRLRTPLIKRGGVFVEATWDEAFTEIERRLLPIRAEFGPQACGLVIGNPTVHRLGLILYVSDLARALGGHQLFTTATLDQMPKQLASGLMFGDFYSIPVPDIERTDLLVVLGANPMVSNGSLWTVPNFRAKAKALRARGGRLVTIDPRRTETAAIANRHYFIRPGADVFLLLGIVHALFDENLVRLGRLAPLIVGIDAVRDVAGPFSPEVVEARCAIAADAIRDLAREIATTPRAAVYGRLGTCTQRFGTLTSWLIEVVNVLTGHFDEPGGAMLPKAAAFASNATGTSARGDGVAVGRYHSRVSAAPEVMGEFPLACLAEEIDTPGVGRLHALITVAGNPVLSAPNGARLAAALDDLDFMLSLDVYVNETTRHADVILPGPSVLEDAHYDVFFSQFAFRNFARYSPPAIPLDPQMRPDWETLLRLIGILEGRGTNVDIAAFDDERIARQLNGVVGGDTILAALATRRGPERILDLALRTGAYGDGFGANPAGLSLDQLLASPDGIDLGPLQPRIPDALRTPSGKIELAPPALLADVRRAGADLAAIAPEFLLIGRRDARSNNSWMHNLRILAKGPFRCTLYVHPDDALRLGVLDGRYARLSAKGRSIDVQVELNDDMMPGVVSLPHGWGHDLDGTRQLLAARRPGVNLNALADESARDPLSGNAVLSGIPVEIRALT